MTPVLSRPMTVMVACCFLTAYMGGQTVTACKQFLCVSEAETGKSFDPHRNFL
jgi:hypothetical protein